MGIVSGQWGGGVVPVLLYFERKRNCFAQYETANLDFVILCAHKFVYTPIFI